MLTNKNSRGSLNEYKKQFEMEHRNKTSKKDIMLEVSKMQLQTLSPSKSNISSSKYKTGRKTEGRYPDKIVSEGMSDYENGLSFIDYKMSQSLKTYDTSKCLNSSRKKKFD
jgi:hypothetical protein